MSHPKVSVIICLYVLTERFYRDLAKFKHLRTSDYELILVGEQDTVLDEKAMPKGLAYRLVRATKKPISLGEKRDLGMAEATGDYCAYIDDDAYPEPGWLDRAVAIFEEDPAIGVVGGPNITAPDDTFWAQVGGAIYESYLTSGGAQLRFVPKKRQDVLELPGVNLIIRTSVLKKLGGFRMQLSSGDDSKICGDIRAMGNRVVYDPGVTVYHHRREFPRGHLRQIRTMGTHRGFFVRSYPETLTPIYFLPTLLAFCFIIGLVLSFFLPWATMLFWGLLAAALVVGFLSCVRRSGVGIAAVAAVGIIATHVVYGLFFFKGMFFSGLKK